MGLCSSDGMAVAEANGCWEAPVRGQSQDLSLRTRLVRLCARHCEPTAVDTVLSTQPILSLGSWVLTRWTAAGTNSHAEHNIIVTYTLPESTVTALSSDCSY